MKKLNMVILISLLYFMFGSASAWTLYYQTSDIGTLRYFYPSNTLGYIPVGYTRSPIYILNISQNVQGTPFALTFVPLSMNGTAMRASNITVLSFTPNSANYTIPASIFTESGLYRITDSKGFGYNFLLMSQQSLPNTPNKNEPIYILLTINLILILILFILVILLRKRSLPIRI